jgi:hypothetical protein
MTYSLDPHRSWEQDWEFTNPEPPLLVPITTENVTERIAWHEKRWLAFRVAFPNWKSAVAILAVCVGTYCTNDNGYYDWQASYQEKAHPTAEATDRQIRQDISDSIDDQNDQNNIRVNSRDSADRLYRSMDKINHAGENRLDNGF